MYVCVHVCMYVCMDVFVHVCMYVCMYVFVHVCVHVCMYVVHVCMYVCACVCMCVCVCLCVRVQGEVVFLSGVCVLHHFDFCCWTCSQEASILVREGLETGDFVFHPTGKWSSLAHNLLHSRVYTLLHLAATMLLMLLALVEYPGVISEDESFYDGYQYTGVVFPVSVSSL